MSYLVKQFRDTVEDLEKNQRSMELVKKLAIHNLRQAADALEAAENKLAAIQHALCEAVTGNPTKDDDRPYTVEEFVGGIKGLEKQLAVEHEISACKEESIKSLQARLVERGEQIARLEAAMKDMAEECCKLRERPQTRDDKGL